MAAARERTRASVANVAGNFAYQATLVVSGFVVPQVVVRSFGSEVNGLLASLTQFVSYFALVEAGISGAAIYSLYAPLANNDWSRVSGIVSAAKSFYIKSGYLFLGLVLGLVVLYTTALDHAGLTVASLIGLVLALGAKALFDFFALAKYRVLLTADQRGWIISLASAGTNLLSVIVLAVVALSGGTVVAAYVFAVLPLVLRSLVLFRYTNRRYRSVDYSAPPNTSALGQRWDALYLQVLGAVQLGAPVILATVLLGDLRLVSALSIYMLITSGIQLIIGVPANSLQASFGDVIARGQTATLQKAYRELEFMVHSIAAAVCGVAFVTIGSFVALYTAGFSDAKYVYPMLGFLAVLDVLLYHMKTPQGLMVIAAGLYRQTRVQTTIQALILVVGGIPLGLLWGLEGIVAAACLSDLYRTVDLLFFVPRHVTGVPPSETVRRMGVTVLSVLLICAPFIAVRISVVSFAEWVLFAAGATLWALVVVCVNGFIFSRPQMQGMWSRVIALLVPRRPAAEGAGGR